MSYFYRRREYFKKHMPGGHDHDQKSHGNWANNGGGGGKGGGAWEHTHKVDVEIEGGIYGKQYQSYDEGVAAARRRELVETLSRLVRGFEGETGLQVLALELSREGGRPGVSARVEL